jgi:dTDP-4-dehydrorhamnose 3,5-epimerase
MRISTLPIDGARLVEVNAHVDERGCFARLWCRETFAAAGLPELQQASASFNALAGTLRGLHFTWPPSAEGKLVRCARGRLHDVLLDLRPDSPSYRQHLAVVLDADERNAVYIPPGVAHGFQALLDASEVHYAMTEAYRPGLADGYRFDDAAFGIAWPLPVSCIGEKDLAWPAFDEATHRARHARKLAEARDAA